VVDDRPNGGPRSLRRRIPRAGRSAGAEWRAVWNLFCEDRWCHAEMVAVARCLLFKRHVHLGWLDGNGAQREMAAVHSGVVRRIIGVSSQVDFACRFNIMRRCAT
jgi:hypothetical protein